MKYETELDLSYNNTMTIFIDNIKDGSTVLEFGPASGRLTRYLKNEKNCKVYIVEIDKEAGEIAAKDACDAVIGDAQGLEWVTKFAGVSFDYVLFADVIEHLTDSKSVVKAAANMLKADGRMCISVPNIAHNSVIIELMNNRFNYTATGLLDNTHVHFFTKESLDEYVRECGLYVEKRYATYTQVGLNEFNNSYEQLPSYLRNYLKIRPMGEVYQLVYVIAKEECAAIEDNIAPNMDYMFAQAFLDKGKGYEEVERRIWTDYSKILTLEIEVDEKDEFLRVDPLNEECIIRLVDAKLVTEDSEAAVSVACHNAAVVVDDMYMFDHDDPQLQLRLNKVSGAVRVELEVCFVGQLIQVVNSINDAMRRADDINNSQHNQISQLREDNALLEEEIDRLKDKLRESEKELSFVMGFVENGRLVSRLFDRYVKKMKKG